MRRREGEETVTIQVGTVTLNGDLSAPARAQGLVLFAHGSGSSRLSPRNRFVAEALRRKGLGTLLFVCCRRSSRTDRRAPSFDVPLLAPIGGVTIGHARSPLPRSRSALRHRRCRRLDRGRPALPDAIGAVVSRGGRPDLAGAVARGVRAPTLLIVGGDDVAVLEMNREALRSNPSSPGARDRPGSDPPVRGARGARGGRAPGGGLVHPSPRPRTRPASPRRESGSSVSASRSDRSVP